MESFSQMGGDINELLTTKMCSPVIVLAIVIAVTAVGLFLASRVMKRYGTYKMENLTNLFTLQELKLGIVLGAIMYGLCQYNKEDLSWIFLIFPVIYIIIQNLLIFIHVISALQNAPKENDVPQHNGYSNIAGQGPSVPQNTSPQQQPRIPPPPVPKAPSQNDFVYPNIGGNTSMSTPLNGLPSHSTLGGNPF